MGVPVPVPNNYASAIASIGGNSVLGQKHNRRAAFNAIFEQKQKIAGGVQTSRRTTIQDPMVKRLSKESSTDPLHV